MWVLSLALLTAFSCARSAHAETSIYVAEQPGLSLEIKAEGEDVYATYLHAKILCYGTGGHWYEGAEPVNHWAFQARPVKLRRSEGHLRLVRSRRGPFDSEREVIEGEIQPDRIVGTFSYFASGEGLGGSCESDAPGFEPKFGKREPPVPFEAQRYVPLGSLLATPPDPAAEALYFQSSGQLEIFLGVQGSMVTKLRGAARETCMTRGGDRDVHRRIFEPAPPFPFEAGEGRFEARSGRDWPYKVASALLDGSVSVEDVVGRYRAAIAYREGRRRRFDAWCRTGGRGGDGYVDYRAIRYVPVQGKPATAGG